MPTQTCLREDAAEVVRKLRHAGHVAYFAGGCVRDLLLGVEPKDYDVATDAPPPRVQELFRNTQAVGTAFGVVLVRQGQSTVEVATFRRDAEYHDGRRPSSVQFTDARQDAQRRDFTVNGLFYDPDSGEVIDFVNGQADLHAKIIRCIGQPEQRLAEDHLRLLRAVRLAARFSFVIEEHTSNAMSASAAKLAVISPERIAEELRLMLTPPTRARAWRLLHRFGLLGVIYRFLSPPSTAPPPDKLLIEAIAPASDAPFPLALAAGALDHLRPGVADVRELLADPSLRRIVGALRQSLKISNDEADLLHDLLASLRPLLADPPATSTQLKRLLARPHASPCRQLLAALADAGLHAQCARSVLTQLSELEKTDFAPPPLIDGQDLIAAGLSPGPLFKRVLDAVYDAQLEGRVTTKDEALALALACP